MTKVSRKSASTLPPVLEALRACLDERTGRYEELKGVSSFGDYVKSTVNAADELVLTETVSPWNTRQVASSGSTRASLRSSALCR